MSDRGHGFDMLFRKDDWQVLFCLLGPMALANGRSLYIWLNRSSARAGRQPIWNPVASVRPAFK